MSEFTVRLMTADDAEQLVGLVRKCYGEGYPNKILYRPEEIAAALENGLMHSIVSEGADGRLIGHCALTFSEQGAPIPEAGKMVVDPDCRGQHLSNRLAEHRKAVAIENNLLGYWSECVTNHPFSQHEIIDSGGVETGAFIAKDAPTWHMAGVNNVTDVRLSLMTYYIPLRTAPVRTIYLPDRYAEFAGSLAQGLGVERDIVQQGPEAETRTVLNYSTNPGNQFAQIVVSVVGTDMGPTIAKLVDRLETDGIQVFHLDMPLGDPNTLRAIPELERQEFFWAAWMPEFSRAGDVLRLQKTDAAVNPQEIVCARENGEQIKQHVLAERARVMKESN
ncbi:MAG: GNAT family N-acetyltransferase [Rhodocyclaceae bacterium]|nr:GNAT family N-acetyltransferase [Rhodocyclaceae bacterium]